MYDPMLDAAPTALATNAVDFLKTWPCPPVLSAAFIHPETGVPVNLPGSKSNFESKSFRPKPGDEVDWSAVATWIEARQGKANLYFDVNEATGFVDKKLSKVTTARVWAFHVDIDPRAATGLEPAETQEAALARITAMVEAYRLPPSTIIPSGGGVQVFWRLNAPIENTGVTEDERKAWCDDVARYITKLAQELEGDIPCRDVSHIMRLPFTVNTPNEKKRKKGREIARSSLAKNDSTLRYGVEQFEKAPGAEPTIAQAAPGGSSIRATATSTVAHGPLTGTDDPILWALPRRAKNIMAEGEDAEEIKTLTKRIRKLEKALAEMAATSAATIDKFEKCIADSGTDAVKRIEAENGIAVERNDSITKIEVEKELEETRARLAHITKHDPSRNAWMYDFVCEAIRVNIPDNVIHAILLDRRFKVSAHILDQGDPKSYASGQIADAHKHVGYTKPIVRYDEAKPDLFVTDTERALMNCNEPIFQSSGRVVRPIRLSNEEIEEGVKRKAGALIIRSLSPTRLNELADIHIHFKKRRKGDADDWVTLIPAPSKITDRYLGRQGDGWQIATLMGIIENPTLREDGSLLTQEGYDRPMGVFLDLNGVVFPTIKQEPSIDDAREALRLLKIPIAEFPFVDDAARAVLLSAMVTAPIRHALRSAPMVATDATTPGTGKTLCANIPSLMLTGRAAPVMSQGVDDEEDEKRLAGVLLRGDNVVLIDNVRRAISGPDVLCSMLTEDSIQIRKLGETGNIQVSARVLVMATGNNIQFDGDMIRRVVISRLDAKLERPEEREHFALDLKSWVPGHRTELVVAALTLVRWYLTARAAKAIAAANFKPSGFPDWDAMVRAPLIAIGEADPWATNAAISSKDTVTGDLGSLLEALHGQGVASFTATELVALAAMHGPIQAALHAVCANRSGMVNTKSIGTYFNRHDGRIVHGLCARRFWNSDKRHWWYRVDEAVEADEQGELVV